MSHHSPITNGSIADQRLLLASQSPRRAQLLKAIGVSFDTSAADIDETPRDGEVPVEYVQRLAFEKANTIAEAHPARLVLGADTTVTVDGEILGKAADPAEAGEMLRRLAGRGHEAHTGVALVRGTDSTVACATTRVFFAPMTPQDIDMYVRSNEWRDKAGAYGIQGRISRFVSGIDGSYTNVVGLPVALVWGLLMRYPEGRGRDRSHS